MYIVTHGDERPIWNMYQTVKYIFEHFSSEYDWFFLIQDDSYTESDRIKSLVNHLSINTDLYMGCPQEFIGGDTDGHYCHGGFGFLLSRSLLIKLQPHLETCRNDILSSRPDEWLGRCIIDYVSVSCVSEYEDEIRNVSGLMAEGEKVSSWPVGINPPFEPRTRFEVLRWDYFTEEQLFSCIDGSPKCELRGIDKMDISNIIETAVEELNKKYLPTLELRKEQLVNGYRRFDPTRGMEYTLDLQLQVLTQKGHSRSITKRVYLVRPLSDIEIIPMPYVTEATRVHIILPLTVHEREQAIRFIELYAVNALESNENAILTLLFIYDPFEAQRVNQNDIFSSVKAKIMDCERKYPESKIPWISVKTDSPCQLKIMDIISKKHPVDTLFFVAGINMEVNFEFLNRCRMNSINQWQVFFPIHFQEYNPEVAYHNQPQPLTIDLLKDSGHFDRDFFDAACFYNSDYMAARGRMASDALENEEILESLDLYEMFVQYSNLHVFRAVEPGLRQKYSQRLCNPRVSEEIYHHCVQSNIQALGSRSQLAMLLFEQEQGNST
ncbi:chondroitin sulfate glucuronyltransferase-like [Chiloscyllium plagiosum]|uniref:chondroitin sulfate glucuronyltransferase-like n=1 Tax=Chiloscyllium plagiosum TaxID=36176 RepID=UPI001CB7BE9E|nr:chondroitin sulfate glucuronyltransferase-like [Chiloscyllium plagiosum]